MTDEEQKEYDRLKTMDKRRAAEILGFDPINPIKSSKNNNEEKQLSEGKK